MTVSARVSTMMIPIMVARRHQESHRASLSLPTVKNAIEKGKPLVTAFEKNLETQPVGGVEIQGWK